MNTIRSGVLPTDKPKKKPKKSDFIKAHKFCSFYVSKITSIYDKDLKDDLIQEGIHSFLKAYQNFDQSLGYSVLTYTLPQIKGDILRAWNRSKSPVNISFTSENLNSIYNLSKQSTDPKEQLRKKYFKNIMSPSNFEDLEDSVLYENSNLCENSTHQKLEKKDMLSKLKTRIVKIKKKLSNFEIDILENRILGDKTLIELGKKYSMSAEGIRKKEARIIKMIGLEFKDEKIGN